MSWWVVPEGSIGQIVNIFSNGPSTTHQIVHAVQSAGKPANVIAGPFSSESEAAASALAYNKKISGPLPQQVAAEAGSALNLTGLAAIGDFFHRFTEASTWMRVGTALLGVILIAVGMARVTGTQNQISSIVKARLP
jgi:hypothetical protein